MPHAAIDQIQKRIESAKQDSDFTYFYALLLEAEALLKTTVLGLLGCLVNDPDRHRYRLEYKILRADGFGHWSVALEDALTGPASQFLLTELSAEKNELTKVCGAGTWQFEAVASLKQCLDTLGIEAEEVPTQTDMKRWFSLFAILRNKTRGHGATMPGIRVHRCPSVVERRFPGSLRKCWCWGGWRYRGRRGLDAGSGVEDEV